jgi:hypothetical protein
MFGCVVMMVKLRIRSPAGERQVPHNPAMPMSRPGTAPSTALQVLLDLEPQAPLQFVFEPPGYQLDDFERAHDQAVVQRQARCLAASGRPRAADAAC